MRILAISGSLRASSSNSALVRAAVALAPQDVEIEVYDLLGEIPPFNPDLDVDPAPPPVARFRDRFGIADAVLISSPEYAHGVSGVMKNALDWLVSSGETIGKPIALVNASPRATIAHAALRETLTVMMAVVVPEASIPLPLQGRNLDAKGIAADPELSRDLRAALAALRKAIEERSSEPPAHLTSGT